MIPNSNRFHGYNSLRTVYRKGETVRSPLLALKHIKNDRRSSYRLGVVVSRKVSKSAVTRNRIRRRLYETVRTLSPALDTPQDILLIVYGKQLAEMPPRELMALVTDLLNRAKLRTPLKS